MIIKMKSNFRDVLDVYDTFDDYLKYNEVDLSMNFKEFFELGGCAYNNVTYHYIIDSTRNIIKNEVIVNYLRKRNINEILFSLL